MYVKKKSPRRTAEEIEQIKQAWQQSGKSKVAFCRESGLNYMTFMAWLSKENRKPQVPAGFVPIEVPSPALQNSSGVFAEIFLSKGRKVIFHQPVSAQYFQQLLK